MLNFLRFTFIVGVIVIIVGVVYTEWTLPGLITPPVVGMVEKDAAGFAEGYTNAVWKKHRTAMIPLLAGTPQAMQNNPEVSQFAQDTAQYFQALPLIRANMYTASGALLLTIGGTETDKLSGITGSPDKDFVADHVKATAAASKLLMDTHSHNDQVALVQTVVPIRVAANADPEGTLEIISAMPDMLQTLAQYQHYTVRGNAAIALFFLVLFSICLFIMMGRSEAIITKQHEANAELMDAVAAAQAQNRDKSQFLANVSHELRTPLNAIIGFSNVLKNEAVPQLTDKKYENYINDIHASGVHLLSLINDILDYSKAEAGKLELEVAEVNATKLVQNSIRLVSPRAEAGQVKLSETLSKDSLIMTTDSKKFKQVLLNLLSNAVKFTPAGGSVNVSAWHNVADDSLTFEVVDTGIGIAPKDISRAMSPFGQVDNTLKRKYEGTGLGLPLTKKFVELMGGKFTIESELNKGTKITFTLPRTIKPRDGVVIKQAS